MNRVNDIRLSEVLLGDPGVTKNAKIKRFHFFNHASATGCCDEKVLRATTRGRYSSLLVVDLTFTRLNPLVRLRFEVGVSEIPALDRIHRDRVRERILRHERMDEPMPPQPTHERSASQPAVRNERRD